MKNILTAFLFIAFILSSIPAFSSNPVILKDSVDSYPLGLHFEYFEDTSGKLTLQDIQKPEIQKKFKKTKKKVSNFGKTKSAFWFKFAVINQMTSDDKLILESSWPLYDHIDLYIQNSSGDFILKKHGNVFPFNHREIKHRNFAFYINPPQNEKQIYYIRIQTETSMQAPFHIITSNYFNQKNLYEYLFLGFLFGGFIIMFIYNLFIFAFTNDKTYFIYILYLIAHLFFQVSYLGIGSQLIWGNFPSFNMHSMPLFLGIGSALTLIFAKSFLNIKSISSKLNILYIFLITTIILLTSCTLYSIYLPLKLLNIAFSLLIFLIIYSSAISLKNGYKPAKYFLISWIILLSGSLMTVLKNVGFIETNFITQNSMQVGILIEISLLSIALANKINVMKEEKENAQKELILNQEIALDTQTKLTNAFARFVPKEFLTFLNKKSIVEVELGDQIQKKMTVLFTDIRSFTTLSEKMSPQENFNFLNSYLKRIGPIIRSNGGFIDKYIGDAVMALFPDSAEKAVDTALLMQNSIIEYNNHRKAIGYDEIAIGIGIHSGNLMLGTIGEENRMEGTVISDNVNLASRIESLTKYYGAEILISGKLFNQLPDKNKYQYRIIDTVIVKGRSEPVTLIEILDQRTTKNYNLKIETKPKLVDAIKLYREKSTEDALNIFKELSTDSQGNDNVYEIYIERCNKLLTEGIPENFTGVEKLENK